MVNDLDTALTNLVGTILQEHGTKWFRYVLRVLKNPADAEDVVQDAVQRVLDCKREFPGEEEARRYLARTVSNLAFELYKRRKRERSRQVPVDGQFPAASCTTDPHTFLERLEQEVERSRVLCLLDAALSQLPVREYEALRITVMDTEGASIREAGQSRGIPFSTLRHRRSKGLRRLRKIVRRALWRQRAVLV